ncbi:PorV/PorQ family protein [bacterium]|nr:MAG: PorV/PorQ family protein [bacterium]
MKKNYQKIVFVLALLIGVTTLATAQKKRGQTSFGFIANPLTARAAGMNDAVYSIDLNAEAMFSNPATMARQQSMFNVSVGQVEFIADINYSYAAISIAPKKGRYGVWGLQLISTDYGEFDETVIDKSNNLSYRDLGTYNPRAFALGLSYARAVSGQFSFGGSVKYLDVNLVNGIVGIDGYEFARQNFSANVFAYDFGVHYKTGWESLELGFAFKNLAQEVTFHTESAEIPLTFRMGVSMDVFDLTEVNKDYNSLIVSINANRPRDFDEQIIIGADYTYMKRFSIRAGYLLPAEEQGISFGAGLTQPINRNGIAISADYSYTTYGIFSGVNRLTVQFSF